MGLCHQQSQQLRSTLSAQSQKRCGQFRPWQNGVPFLALQAKTVKARGKFEISPFNFPQQPQQNHMTRLLQSPWCAHCYFGRKSELLLYKFHLMPERPSVSKTASPTSACKATLPETREKGKKNLINLQNACDLLYIIITAHQHDKFPALGAGSRWFQQFLASAPDRLQGL